MSKATANLSIAFKEMAVHGNKYPSPGGSANSYYKIIEKFIKSHSLCSHSSSPYAIPSTNLEFLGCWVQFGSGSKFATKALMGKRGDSLLPWKSINTPKQSLSLALWPFGFPFGGAAMRI